MAFRFALGSLLRLRQSIEHQQELLLQKATQAVLSVQRDIEDVDRRVATILTAEADQLGLGVTAAELQFAELCRSLLREFRSDLEHELGRRQEARQQQSERFQAARRDREVIESLRQRQLQVYRVQENRREQRRMDDLLLLRREFQRHS